MAASPTIDTFSDLAQLYARPATCALAAQRAGAIPRGDLASWLSAHVGNPAAEAYLLDLFAQACTPSPAGARAYRRFYRELALRSHAPVHRQVIGEGEISQVAVLSGAAFSCWRHPGTGQAMPVVYKKMPPFLNRGDAEEYVKWYHAYNTALRDRVGIHVPEFDARIVERGGLAIIYVIQERLPSNSVCHGILRTASPAAARRLFRLILRQYEKLDSYNRHRTAHDCQVGLDGQSPNWAVLGYEGDPESVDDQPLAYLDTNVPMLRVDGADVVSSDMYFQSLPGSARWLIKRIKLDEQVMDRYFQLRLIMLDFLGNLIVQHRPDLVPPLVEMSNDALAGPLAAAELAPFTVREVQKYYRSDVAIWRLWRSLKLIGAVSDRVSARDFRAIGRLGQIYRIWTRPIFD